MNARLNVHKLREEQEEYARLCDRARAPYRWGFSSWGFSVSTSNR